MNSLINVSEGYTQNLGSLGPLLHVEKFVVVVGGGGWKTKFSVHLREAFTRKNREKIGVLPNWGFPPPFSEAKKVW